MCDKTYEITFYGLHGEIDSTQQYSSLPVARNVFLMFDEEQSKDLYSRIILAEFNWRSKEQRIYDVLQFAEFSTGKDWRTWEVGRYTVHEWDEFDSRGSSRGLITEKYEDHLIMESEGMQLWIDDCFADMFR